MKIEAGFSKDADGQARYAVKINGVVEAEFCFSPYFPEDNNFNAGFSDVLELPGILNAVFNAGQSAPNDTCEITKH